MRQVTESRFTALASRLLLRQTMRLAPMILLMTACADRTTTIPEPPKQHSASIFDIPVGVAFETDILVVIDSSPAMAPHADRAIPQIAKLFGSLAQQGDPDWHLAVITSDLGGPDCSERGDDGRFRSDGLVGSPFLIEWRHFDGRHTANYQDTLETAFARIATVGTSGCPRQQPLAAIRRALEDQPRNAGFRRDGAGLMILVVSAGDDASPELVADHIAFLDGAVPEDRSLTMLGIYDRPAARLDAVITALSRDRLQISPLRADDVTENLHFWIGGGRGWGVPCLEGTIGPVPECSISDVLVEHEQAVFERLLPPCDASSSVKPCWHIERDPQNCPTWLGSESHVLEIERYDYPPLGTHVRGSCVTRSGQNP